MTAFRKLRKDEIQVRIAQVTQNKTYLLLYKDARCDMNILDETVKPQNWACDYKEIKGNMYCGIGIRIASVGVNEWVWKWDCGIESKENDGNEKKGEASDAFKRAGFKWGIGRELYTAPIISVENDAIGGTVEKEYQGKKYYYLKNSWVKFYVREIQYDEKTGDISKLTIVDSKGNVVWSNIH